PDAAVTAGAHESLEAYEAMLRGYRSGTLELDQPVFLALTPSVIVRSRAPAGHHTFKLVSFLPYELEDGPEDWDRIKDDVAKELFDKLVPLTSNLSPSIVLGYRVESPLDL